MSPQLREDKDGRNSLLNGRSDREPGASLNARYWIEDSTYFTSTDISNPSFKNIIRLIFPCIQIGYCFAINVANLIDFAINVANLSRGPYLGALGRIPKRICFEIPLSLPNPWFTKALLETWASLSYYWISSLMISIRLIFFNLVSRSCYLGEHWFSLNKTLYDVNHRFRLNLTFDHIW